MRRTRGMRTQLVQVCTLCGWPADTASPSLPDGLHLLNRLYSVAKSCDCTPEHCSTAPTSWPQLVYVLFTEALQPFVRFAEAWMRHGLVDDPFAEFFDPKMMQTAALRTDMAHTHNNDAPSFLSLRAWNQLLRCGSTVRLLQRYEPAHYLLQSSVPALGVGGALTGVAADAELDGTWSWLHLYGRRRHMWVSMVQAGAEKRELERERILASASHPAISDTAVAVREAATQVAATKVATAEEVHRQRVLYATELREQIQTDQKRLQRTDVEEDQSIGLSMFSQIFPDDVQMVAELIEQEYAVKLGRVEARIARLSWQQRRMGLQGARLRHWRSEAESESLLLSKHDERTARPVEAAASEQTGVLTDKSSGVDGLPDGLLETDAQRDSSTGPSDEEDPNQHIHSLPVPPRHEEIVSAVESEVTNDQVVLLSEQVFDIDVATVAAATEHSSSERHGENTRNSEVRHGEPSSVAPGKSVPMEARHGTETSFRGEHAVNLAQAQPTQGRSHGIPGSVWSTLRLPKVPLSVILERCLQGTIEQQDNLAQSAAVRMYLHRAELDLLQHLRNLREYCLTGSPGFAAALSASLCDGAHSGRTWLTRHNCAVALSSAFAASGTRDHVAALFDLTVTVAQKPSGTPAIEDLDALETCGVQIQYTPAASWPLDLILDSSSLQQYNALWRMLMKVQRMLDAGRSLWLLLKQMSQSGSVPGAQVNRLSLVRHDVQHFANVLQDYFMTQVLHVQWARLERELSDAEQVGSICELHRGYLERLMSGCLLRRSSAGALKVILCMFELVLTFAAQLTAFESGHRSGSEPAPRAFQEMLRTGALFRKHAEFLTRLLRKQAEMAPTPALRAQAEELVRRLDNNSMRPG